MPAAPTHTVTKVDIRATAVREGCEAPESDAPRTNEGFRSLLDLFSSDKAPAGSDGSVILPPVKQVNSGGLVEGADVVRPREAKKDDAPTADAMAVALAASLALAVRSTEPQVPAAEGNMSSGASQSSEITVQGASPGRSAMADPRSSTAVSESPASCGGTGNSLLPPLPEAMKVPHQKELDLPASLQSGQGDGSNFQLVKKADTPARALETMAAESDSGQARHFPTEDKPRGNGAPTAAVGVIASGGIRSQQPAENQSLNGPTDEKLLIIATQQSRSAPLRDRSRSRAIENLSPDAEETPSPSTSRVMSAAQQFATELASSPQQKERAQTDADSRDANSAKGQQSDAGIALQPSGTTATVSSATAAGQPRQPASPTTWPEAARSASTAHSSDLVRDTPAPVLQTAQLLQDLRRSEIRIGLQTENFGSIRVHATVADDQVGAVISTSHPALSAALAAETPSLEHGIAQHRLHLGSLTLNTSTGNSGNDEPGTGRESRQPDIHRTLVSSPPEGRALAVAATGTGVGDVRRLDITA